MPFLKLTNTAKGKQLNINRLLRTNETVVLNSGSERVLDVIELQPEYHSVLKIFEPDLKVESFDKVPEPPVKKQDDKAAKKAAEDKAKKEAAEKLAKEQEDAKKLAEAELKKKQDEEAAKKLAEEQSQTATKETK